MDAIVLLVRSSRCQANVTAYLFRDTEALFVHIRGMRVFGPAFALTWIALLSA